MVDAAHAVASRSTQSGSRRDDIRGTGWSGFEVVGVLCVLVALAACVVGALVGRPEMLVGLVVMPVLVLLAAPLAAASRRGRSFDLGGLLMAALGARLAGSAARYLVLYEGYGGVGDAVDYHRAGERVARQLRAFDLPANLDLPGTDFIRLTTGVLYSVTGANQFVAFLSFTFLSFLGVYGFYRAFELAVPSGSHQRYAVLLFFWPSLVFWPSSLGKEAWMVFALGVTAAGAAGLLTGRRGGVPLATVGVLGVAMVRPHVALLVVASIIAGFVVQSTRSSTLRFPAKLASLAVLAIGAVVLVERAEAFLGIEELSFETVDATLDVVEGRTAQGGSSYDPVRVRGPLDVPAALGTVLFRPLPHEARGGAAVASALEGVLLAGLVLVSWRRLAAIPLVAHRLPYVVVAVMFVLMFAYAFAALGNFGILVRQRTQALPFLLVLLALSPVAARRSGVERVRVE